MFVGTWTVSLAVYLAIAMPLSNIYITPIFQTKEEDNRSQTPDAQTLFWFLL